MSNYNLEGFPGFEECIVGGPEVVNGTGKVSLKFYDGEQMVFFVLDHEEVLRFADWLAGHAFEAMKQQWREHHTLSDHQR